MMLLPPKPGVCPICAVDHRPLDPHNAHSMYYQYRFYGTHGRWPTWADAVAHCTPERQSAWKETLERMFPGQWTEPPGGVEVIADPPAESIRQPIGDISARTFEAEE